MKANVNGVFGNQTSYEDQKTVCPFYLSDNPYHTQSILCEGIVEDCRNLSVFGDKKAKLNRTLIKIKS